MHINITVTVAEEKYTYGNKPKGDAEIDIDSDKITPEMLALLPQIARGLAEVAVAKFELSKNGEEI